MFWIPSLALGIKPQHSAPGGCGHVHPCCRSCLCKRTTTPKMHRSKAAEQHFDDFNNLLLDLWHWHSHNLLHGSFRHPLLWNHLDHVNDLLLDLRYQNSDNYQVHQAHLFIINLTQGRMKTFVECVFGEDDKHTCSVRPCSSCAPPTP